MKKIFLFFFLFTFSLHAEIIASGNDCGDDCHWEIDARTKTLTITGNGAIKDYERIYSADAMEYTTSAPWREYVYQVENVNIGEGITSVGYDAFEDMYSVKNVSLPSTLTDIKDLAFHTCTNLQEITLPEKLKNIGDAAFSASALRSVTFPESLESIGQYAFPMLKTAILQSAKDLALGAFGDDIAGRNDTWNQSRLENLYCQTELMEKCNKIASSLGIEATEYKKLPNGRYAVNEKQFLSLTDIQNGRIYTPKRIYTIKEAEMVSKPTGNTFMIRYK
ncbi:MAG: leucine-rich repeat domain-containing protein [Alphaproteobacteria bacterium]|nr:leucine-rich repeat domain-containing protein [Alphaproteobacteria bacterium]